jgi:hypothetical protein
MLNMMNTNPRTTPCLDENETQPNKKIILGGRQVCGRQTGEQCANTTHTNNKTNAKQHTKQTLCGGASGRRGGRR